MRNLPWWGNDDFFATQYDTFPHNSLFLNKNSNLYFNTTYIIPIVFWINLPSVNTSYNWEEVALQSIMDGVNQGFQSNGLNTFFYVKCINYINDSALEFIDYSDMSLNSPYGQLTSNYDNSAVNIYVVADIDDSSNPNPAFNPAGVYFGADDLIILGFGGNMVFRH